MNNAEDARGVVAFNVTVEHVIGKDDAKPNMRPKLWPRRTTIGIVGKPLTEAFKAKIVLVGERRTRYGGEVGENIDHVRVGGRGDDDASRYPS
ncbi:MAG TPA: hypothetical protein VME69_06205 [Methylocella sp.]|nr:hypothetical protein [Methylocella sp.]